MTDRGYMLPSQRDDWGTPQKLFDELNKEFHFDLDAAAKKKNWTVSALGDYCPQCLNQIVKEAEND